MTIDGGAVAADGSFGVANPATNEQFAEAPSCTAEQLDAAMTGASRALRSWGADEEARRAALASAAKVLMEAAPEIGKVLTEEQGKPLAEAQGEVYGAAMWFQYFADVDVPHDVLQDDDIALVQIVRRPVGVVAAITAWNYPLILAAFKAAPALRAGNTMVLKPSPYTPLSTLAFGEALRGVLPDGVLNVVSGGNDLGAWMTEHPVPRKVSFTGSIATGKKVAASATKDLKRMTLELGGNDPAIVLADADVDEIADRIFWSSFTNCGQVCNAIKRVYAPSSLRDDLAEALAERARTVKVGDGMAEGTQIGPLNNRPQFDRVRDLVGEALASGASALAGGSEIEGSGNFFAPTVLVDAPEDGRLVAEEQFGPALPIIEYDRIEDAIERANSTHFGLSASVWSNDLDRAADVAAELECGTSWVNTHMAAAPHQPFGGTKWSGVGRENGLLGLMEFTEPQIVHVQRSAAPMG